MIIKKVDVFRLEQPVATPTGPAGVTYTTRRAVLVRIEDSDGQVGWGETYATAGVVAAIESMAEVIVGQRVSPRPLTDRVRAGMVDHLAASAISIALDDLRGRQLGLPLAELYGGRRRETVRAYASSGGYREGVPPEESWPEETAAAVADGFTACKIRIGRHPATRELPILERVRAQVGEGIDLMVDANGAYSVPTALGVGRELGRLRFRWFEEPLIRYSNGLAYPGYERLSGLGVPIAAGEGLQTRSAFDSFLARGAADIIQPDVAICGGVAEVLFVAELAALRGVPCVPHAWGGAVLLAATLQAISLLPEPSELAGPDSPLLEFDRFENPMRDRLSGHRFEVRDGQVEIPSGPGLGITVDEDFVRQTAL